MIGQQTEDVEKKSIAILKALSESSHPLGSRMLARQLSDQGINLSERTVRYYLNLMDKKGLTRVIGRRDGRSITNSGIEEVNNALISDRVGLMLTKINSIVYKCSFKIKLKSGTVPANVSLFPSEQFNHAVEAMKDTFRSRINVSNLVSVGTEGY